MFGAVRPALGSRCQRHRKCWFHTPDLELIEILFRWSTPHRDDSVHALARDVPIRGRLYECERALRMRARHELEVEQLLQPP